MEISSKRAERNLLLELKGELDHHGAKRAMEMIEQEIDAALPLRLVLDFSGVTFMDSSGIAVLLRSQRRMQCYGGSMLLCGVSAQAGRILEVAGVGRFIHMKKEREHALDQ